MKQCMIALEEKYIVFRKKGNTASFYSFVITTIKENNNILKK